MMISAFFSLVPLALFASVQSRVIPRDLTALSQCLTTAGIDTLVPTDPSYAQASAAYNQRLTYQPLAIAYPNNAQQVAAAVTCGAQNGIQTNARSGGHSYTAYSLGGTDGALVIDLSRLTAISLLSDGTTAFIETGNRLGDVALGLYNANQRALPHGTCPEVGVGGHASFGGYGLDSRAWGLTIDHIVGHDVVLANGTYLQNVTPTSNPDLSFALTGAAPSFGIITAYYFDTVPAPTVNTVIDLSFGDLDVSTLTQFILTFQSFGQTSCPAELTLEIVLGAGGSPGTVNVAISGGYLGSEDGYYSAIQPLLSVLPVSATNADVEPLGWLASLEKLGGVTTLNTTGVQDSRDTFFAGSLMIPESSPMTSSAVTALVNYLATTGQSASDLSWFIQIDLYGGANSAISNPPSTVVSSYGQRDKLLNFQIYASSANFAPPYPNDGLTFVQGVRSAVVDNMTFSTPYGGYINYDEDDLSATQWPEFYYGSNIFSRLQTIKGQVDPQNVFRWPQSIPLPSTV